MSSQLMNPDGLRSGAGGVLEQVHRGVETLQPLPYAPKPGHTIFRSKYHNYSVTLLAPTAEMDFRTGRKVEKKGEKAKFRQGVYSTDKAEFIEILRADPYYGIDFVEETQVKVASNTRDNEQLVKILLNLDEDQLGKAIDQVYALKEAAEKIQAHAVPVREVSKAKPGMPADDADEKKDANQA